MNDHEPWLKMGFYASQIVFMSQPSIQDSASTPAPADLVNHPDNHPDNQYGDRAIAEAAQTLEKWPSPSTNAYVIHLEHPEFTALCPRSGYPDFGTIVVDYQPAEWVVELKAFKLYINGFRDQRISHETVVNQISDFLWHELQPVGLRIIGDFTRRGGIKTVITVGRGSTDLFEPYRANTL